MIYEIGQRKLNDEFPNSLWMCRNCIIQPWISRYEIL